MTWQMLTWTLTSLLPLTATAGEAYMGTVAGNGTSGFSGDGSFALAAQISAIEGVAVDAQHNVYFSDTGNHRIRKITAATGIITTIAGNGSPTSTGDGGQASSATLNTPSGLALTAGDVLYIAERGGHRIRRITISTGVISTVAGTGTGGYDGDGLSATSTRLNYPNSVAVNAAGDLFISDTNNQRIRKVSGGIISTVAGVGTPGLSGDGGVATAAQLNYPNGVALTAAGNLLIADTNNSRVRQVTGTTISSIAGTTYGFSGDGGVATAAQMGAPRRILVLANGDLLVSDHALSRVRKIAAGIITTVYGTGSASYSGDGGLASAAAISSPQEMTLDSTGTVFFADMYNYRIRVASLGPVIKNLPVTSSNPLFATTTGASVLGASTAGESTVLYTWSTVGTPPAPVTYSPNGTNAAKSTTATFTRAGTYQLAVNLTQGSTLAQKTGVTVTVGQVPTTLTISPTSKTLALNATQAFTVGGTGTDQFGQSITALLPTWSLIGAGTFSTAGFYTAPGVPGGPYTVQAVVGPRSVTAPVTVSNTPPTLSSITATPTTVTGTTTTLTANTSDDGGLSNLTYTWTPSGAPPAPVYFGNNGVNAAKSTVVTFVEPGSYSFQVEVRDTYGLTTTGTTSVTVVSTLTTVTVTPPGSTINPGTSRTFTAACFNQFGQTYTPVPTWSWTRSGGGTIVSTTGVLTASSTPGGPYTVTATGGGKSGQTTFSVGTASPIAHGQAITVVKDTPHALTLTASDANLDLLTFTTVTPPGNGTLSGTPPNVTYHPAAGYAGSDSFTFTASDGSLTSAPATVQVAVLEQSVVIDSGRTPLVLGDYFDANRWALDSAYRTAYVAAAVPGRVWHPASPGSGVPVLGASAQRFSVAPATTLTLSVTAIAGAPVSFTCFGEGRFSANAQNSITVTANAQGVAQASFEAPRSGPVPILVASPLCQGRLRIVVQVTTP